MKKILSVLSLIMFMYCAYGLNKYGNSIPVLSTPLPLIAPVAWKHLFLTDIAYDGNLGGITQNGGANDKCNADVLGLPALKQTNQYEAVLYPQRYPNIAGATVSNFTSPNQIGYYITNRQGYLIDYSLTRKINHDGTSFSIDATKNDLIYAWGGNSTYSCNNWTTNSSTNIGALRRGRAGIALSGKDMGGSSVSCNERFSIVCVQK